LALSVWSTYFQSSIKQNQCEAEKNPVIALVGSLSAESISKEIGEFKGFLSGAQSLKNPIARGGGEISILVWNPV
jgi:hypothetical protein